jgi:ABC-type glycerol-3-phosphate transport system substrate-binding protein
MRRLLPLMLLIALLSGCAGAPEQPGLTPEPGATAVPSGATPAPEATAEAEEGQVVISYAAWESERSLYEPLAQKFTAENPNIKVVVVPLDDLLNNPNQNTPDGPLSALRRIVSGADTAPAFFAGPEAYGSNLMLDLKPLMDADSAFDRGDFYPGALEQYTVNGGTWMLPRYLNVQLLSYNKDLFANANLPTPKPGWTWTDLLGVSEQIAKKSGSRVDTYGFLDPSGGFLPLIALLNEQKIDLLSTPADKIQLDRPEIVDAIKRIQSLVDSGALFRPQYSKEGPADGPGVDISQLIRDGKVGIWGQEYVAFDGPGGGDGSQPPEFSFEVGKLPYPTLFANFYGGGGDGYLISSGTAHPNEAWKWIEFLSRQNTDQNGQAMPINYGPGRIPARQSLAEQSGFWKNIDAETAEAYKWAIAHPGPQLERTPDYTIFGVLGPALEQVLGENKDPQKVLQEAQKQLADQIAQVQLTPTPTPETGPVVVATPEAQVAPEGATTVTFDATGFNNSDLRRLARAFRDQRPDIFVQIKSTDALTEPPQLSKIAQTSDCFSWWATPQSEADFKALLDLQPLFDADPSFPQSDYAPGYLAPYRSNGGLFGLPYAVNLRTLNYNRTAFDAAGIQVPTYQWKPDDFLAAAQALTKGEGDNKQYGYVPLGGPQQDMIFFVNQFGGQLMTGSGKDARPNFDDPKVVAALKWYLDLSKTHKVMPEVQFPYKRDTPGYNDGSYELIQNGRAGMWFDQGRGMFGNYGGIKEGGPGGPPAPNFEVGVAPLPIGAAGLGSTDLNVRGFHISAQTQQAQGCWEWLKFLSSDITSLQGSLPARASVAQSDAFTQQASPDLVELAKIYSEALKQSSSQAGQPVDMNAFWSLDQYWFNKALSEALEDKTDLAQGLAEAQKFTTAYLDCLEKTPNKPATCANQVDPSYQGYNIEDPPEGGFFPRG